MVYLTFFCTISLLIYTVFIFKSERKEHLKRRMATFVDQEKEMKKELVEADHGEKELSLVKRIFTPLWKEFKRGFHKRMPGEKVAKIEILLLQAGSPLGMTPVEYRLLQLSLITIFPLLAWLYALVLQASLGVVILFIILATVIALFLPNFYLKLKIKSRNKLALRELPDVLDLLTVSLEAGLGFDSALSKLISKKEGILALEFHRCLEEIRLGKTRREALSGVRDRILVDEVKVLISSILQAEKLGIGLVQVLRIQSEEVRDKRKQRAEEEAMKAPIKMLFPLVLFIFPSLFIVLLGPAMINFIETFSK